ncbi:MAG: ATP-binding cassette domain-containing protein, partial [Rhodosalinus sp.]
IADRATVLRDGRNAGVFERATMDRAGVIEAIVGRRGELSARKSGSHIRESAAMETEGLSGGVAEDVTLTLRHGEILGVAGLPGSGAEDVLSLLFGRIRRRAGTVRKGDLDLRLREPAEAIAAGIAFVPADRLAESVFHAESIRSNITMPSLARYLRDPVLRLVNRRAESRASRAVAERMRVRMPGIETAIDDLSGGNQQKVVLGRWLSAGAQVFLLNSPTAAVDVGAKAEIYELIEELAGEGAGILFASTELEEYPVICDRVLVFFRGRLAGELKGEQVTEQNIMTLAAGETLKNGCD